MKGNQNFILILIIFFLNTNLFIEYAYNLSGGTLKEFHTSVGYNVPKFSA